MSRYLAAPDCWFCDTDGCMADREVSWTDAEGYHAHPVARRCVRALCAWIDSTALRAAGRPVVVVDEPLELEPSDWDAALSGLVDGLWGGPSPVEPTPTERCSHALLAWIEGCVTECSRISTHTAACDARFREALAAAKAHAETDHIG